MQPETQLSQRKPPPSSRNVRNVVFASVGVALLVGSALLKSVNDLAHAVTLNLGIVIVAVLIFDYLWQVCGGDPIASQITLLSRQVDRLSQSVDVIESSRNIGLAGVYDKLGNFGNQAAWDDLIESSTANVDLLGRTLHGWTQSGDIAKTIKTKIERDGVVFRWLIMDKENRFMPLLEEREVALSSLLTGKLDNVRRLLRDIHGSLEPEHRTSFQVRTFTHLPLYCSIIRVDDRYYVNQYLWSSNAANSPFFCVRGVSAAWPEAFRREFREVWRQGSPLFTEGTVGGSANG